METNQTLRGSASWHYVTMEWVELGYTHMHYTHAHILTSSSPPPPSPHLPPTHFAHPPAANIIQPLPGNRKCKLTMLTQVDPGGFAPPVLINHVRLHYHCFSLCRQFSLSVFHCYFFSFQRFVLYFYFCFFFFFSGYYPLP